ncbi:MAG TPA: 30S ribosomal protein S17 [Rhodanobacteraceae bacterium]|nr:30S ribosomal protein S17 [Rhodanobacteraceae bacterium]
MSDAQNQVEKSGTRTLQGRVTSSKAAKTVTVSVDRQEQHGVYGKLLRRSTKLHAHDEKGECHEGDLVRIAECRPLSKTKHFRVVEVLARAAE